MLMRLSYVIVYCWCIADYEIYSWMLTPDLDFEVKLNWKQQLLLLLTQGKTTGENLLFTNFVHTNPDQPTGSVSNTIY